MTNKTNGKVYVGQTSAKYVSQRMGKHRTCAKEGKDTFFYRAIRKYGWKSFEVNLLDKVASKDESDNLEKMWIVLLDARNRNCGYNTKAGGEGARHAQSTKDKISRIQLANPRPPEFYRDIGAKVSPELRSSCIKQAWAEGKYAKRKSNAEGMRRAWADGRMKNAGAKAKDLDLEFARSQRADGYTYGEISAQMGCSDTTLCARLKEAACLN